MTSQENSGETKGKRVWNSEKCDAGMNQKFPFIAKKARENARAKIREENEARAQK